MQKENQGTGGGLHRLALELYGRKGWQNVAHCFETVIALDSPNQKDATACIEALAQGGGDSMVEKCRPFSR